MRQIPDNPVFRCGQTALIAAFAIVVAFFIATNVGCSKSTPTQCEEIESLLDTPPASIASPQAEAPADKKNGEGDVSLPLTRIIFITTSRACKCTMNRCKNGEDALKKAMAKHTKAPKVERIDYASQPNQVTQLAKKYKGMMLPMIYLLDEGDNLLWKAEGNIDWAEVDLALEKYSAVGP